MSALVVSRIESMPEDLVKSVPFGVDVSALADRARMWIRKRVAGATLSSTGGISFQIRATDPERDVARKLVVRLRDRRVFTAADCCDGCIRNTIHSLIEVRKILVDAQVDLINLHDGDLFWVTDYLRLVIASFVTWEERMREAAHQVRASDPKRDEELYIDPAYRAVYFATLDLVRAHARGALAAITEIAAMSLPRDLVVPQLPAASIFGLATTDEHT